MNDFVRVMGSAVIALMLMSIPGLLVASFVFEWHGFLKALFIIATMVEQSLIMNFVYERREE